LTPPPLVLLTLPPPHSLLINAPPHLVRWRISSCLLMLAGWLSRRLLSHRLRLALPFVAQPPLAFILDPPSSLVPAGCCIAPCRTASASQRAAGSRVASCSPLSYHGGRIGGRGNGGDRGSGGNKGSGGNRCSGWDDGDRGGSGRGVAAHQQQWCHGAAEATAATAVATQWQQQQWWR
jgi:hypothetical protein